MIVCQYFSRFLRECEKCSFIACDRTWVWVCTHLITHVLYIFCPCRDIFLLFDLKNTLWSHCNMHSSTSGLELWLWSCSFGYFSWNWQIVSVLRGTHQCCLCFLHKIYDISKFDIGYCWHVAKKTWNSTSSYIKKIFFSPLKSQWHEVIMAFQSLKFCKWINISLELKIILIPNWKTFFVVY